jgi:T5SS/PEP-CTERM-associated repeat protein
MSRAFGYRTVRKVGRSHSIRLGVEQLEVRALLATWSNAAGGPFDDADNWTPTGVPGPTTDVVFDLASAYTVTIANSAQANNVRVDRGPVTFDIQSDLTFEKSDFGTLSQAAAALFTTSVVPPDPGEIAGYVASNDIVTIGNQPEVVARVTAEGLFKWYYNDSIIVANTANSRGVLTVQDFAVLEGNTNPLILAKETGSNGETVVQGFGEVRFTPITVGQKGVGKLQVIDSGSVRSYAVVIGDEPGSTGRVEVNNYGQLVNDYGSGDVYVGNRGQGVLASNV